MVTGMVDLPMRKSAQRRFLLRSRLLLFSLTIRGPRQLAAERGLLCVDPEPDGGGGVPGVDVLTSGDFGQVGLEGTRVVNVRVDADAH